MSEIKLVESPKCNICYEYYNSNSRNPIIFNCNHTVCNSCYIRLKIKKCPICKTKITSYATNLALRDCISEEPNIPSKVSNEANKENHENLFYCYNNHLLTYANKSCIIHFAEKDCLVCEKCDYSRCLDICLENKVKFYDSKCILNHKLKFSIKKSQSKCYRCKRQYLTTMNCKDCSIDQCLFCSNFKFSVKACLNNHELKWNPEKVKCSRCLVTEKGVGCKSCKYSICILCFDIEKKCTELLPIIQVVSVNSYVYFINMFTTEALKIRKGDCLLSLYSLDLVIISLNTNFFVYNLSGSFKYSFDTKMKINGMCSIEDDIICCTNGLIYQFYKVTNKEASLNRKIILEYENINLKTHNRFDSKLTKLSYYPPLKSLLINDRDNLYTFDIDKKDIKILFSCNFCYDIKHNYLYILNNEHDSNSSLKIFDFECLDNTCQAITYASPISLIKSIEKNEVLICVDNKIELLNIKFEKFMKSREVPIEGNISSIVNINEKMIGVVYEAQNKIVAFNIDNELIAFTWTL